MSVEDAVRVSEVAGEAAGASELVDHVSCFVFRVLDAVDEPGVVTDPVGFFLPVCAEYTECDAHHRVAVDRVSVVVHVDYFALHCVCHGVCLSLVCYSLSAMSCSRRVSAS